MKFADLVEFPHTAISRARVWRCGFPNGYGVDIVSGPYLYSGPNTYEVAEIIFDNPPTEPTVYTSSSESPTFYLTYEHTGGDVLGYQTAQDIDRFLEMLEKLEPVKKC